MKPKEKKAVKAMAADAARTLEKSTNCGISAWNFGLSSTEEVLDALRAALPGVTVNAGGFMGYIHFEKKG